MRASLVRGYTPDLVWTDETTNKAFPEEGRRAKRSRPARRASGGAAWQA